MPASKLRERANKSASKRALVAVDLFCGVGGFSLGFERAGFKVAAAFDNDPINVETYRKNFSSTKVQQVDLSKITGRELLAAAGLESTRVDVVFGGPPCQGFSQMGKRNLEDPRNSLLGSFARLVAEIKPSYFVLENVEGLILGKARVMLARFLRKVRSSGYKFAAPIRVLDAAEYGVPQRRRRVFVIGCLREQALPTYPKVIEEKAPTVWDAISDICIQDGNLEGDVFEGRLKNPSGYAKRLRKRISGRMTKMARISGFSMTFHSKKTIRRFAKTEPGETEPVSRFFRLNKSGVSNTLRAGTDRSRGSFTAARPIHPTVNRCITVREAARLHSFPDAFSFHQTIWHGFRQVGNSVPPILSRKIAGQIKAAAKQRKEPNECR